MIFCHRRPLKNVVMSTMRIARSLRTLRDPGFPPQVGVGSRKVRTDLARSFATAASIDQILFSLWRGSRRLPPQVRAGSREVRTDLARRFHCGRVGFVAWVLLSLLVVALSSALASAWCLASRRVGFLEDYLRAARAFSLCWYDMRLNPPKSQSCLSL